MSLQQKCDVQAHNADKNVDEPMLSEKGENWPRQRLGGGKKREFHFLH